MTEFSAQRVVLESPIVGVPQRSDFRLESFRVPELRDGQFLIRNVYCSVDPGTRSRLSAGVSYTANLKAGEMISSFAMGQVKESKHPGYAIGDWVVHASGWAQYQVADGRGYFQKLESRWVESGLAASSGKPGVPLSAWIGVLGIPGMTAWFGMTRIGAVTEGARVLVSSAAGPVGASAGQIARQLGAANVVGIAGGPVKCRWLKNEARFDHAIDYKSVRAASGNDASYVAQMQAQLQAASPDGYDVLFDNVGNTLIDMVIPLLRPHARIVISGQVADYNRSAEEMPGLFNTRHFIAKRLRMEGILVFDDRKQFGVAQDQIAGWMADAKFAWKEQLFVGIEALPEAFIDLFTGDGFGRRIVQVGQVNETK